jgi:hypothetical protein
VTVFNVTASDYTLGASLGGAPRLLLPIPAGANGTSLPPVALRGGAGVRLADVSAPEGCAPVEHNGTSDAAWLFNCSPRGAVPAGRYAFRFSAGGAAAAAGCAPSAYAVALAFPNGSYPLAVSLPAGQAAQADEVCAPGDAAAFSVVLGVSGAAAPDVGLSDLWASSPACAPAPSAHGLAFRCEFGPGNWSSSFGVLKDGARPRWARQGRRPARGAAGPRRAALRFRAVRSGERAHWARGGLVGIRPLSPSITGRPGVVRSPRGPTAAHHPALHASPIPLQTQTPRRLQHNRQRHRLLLRRLARLHARRGVGRRPRRRRPAAAARAGRRCRRRLRDPGRWHRIG